MPRKETVLPEGATLLTVMVTEAVAVLPAASLAVALRVWDPLPTVVLFQLML